MSAELTQSLGQTQKLNLNLAMKQSLNILQMPLQELQIEIEQALVDNPLLEVREPDILKGLEDASEEMLFRKSEMKSNAIGTTEYEDAFNYIPQKKTLKDYVSEQIYDLGLSDTMKSICLYVLENIDVNGYLNISSKEMANALKSDSECVQKAIFHIQSLEPIGIGAKDLRECLKIQLNRKNLLNDKMIELIDHYLELIGMNKIPEIAKKMNLTIQQVQTMCQELKKLEPKPTRGFFLGEVEGYIIPEAYIRKIDDAWYIVMNDRALPKLYISNIYKTIIKQKEDVQACEYIQEKMNSAMGILKGIEQRHRTIYKILEQLIELQKEYFELGEGYLKPMSIKDIADRLKMHESTVSRAIKEKYVSTPHKMILLKSFFTTGIEDENCDKTISSLTIKTMIKGLIDKEESKKPLSDQQMCDQLIERGIKISRRTVTKYREALEIPTASVRKEF